MSINADLVSVSNVFQIHSLSPFRSTITTTLSINFWFQEEKKRYMIIYYIYEIKIE